MKQKDYVRSPENLARLKAQAVSRRKGPSIQVRITKQIYARLLLRFHNRFARRNFVEKVVTDALDALDARDKGKSK